MITPKSRSAYDLLLQAIQQQNAQQPTAASPQGGLLGMLQAAQAIKDPWQAAALNSDTIDLEPKDPNFRRLASFIRPAEVEAPSIVPDGADGLAATFDGPVPASGGMQFAMGRRKPTYSECVNECMHILLNPPNGDLQSSDFRRCVGQCMGRL